MKPPIVPTVPLLERAPAERLRPRLLTHRGVVEASALLFDTPLLTQEAARGRILAMWMPGAAVYRLEAGLLLRLPVPCRVVCAVAPGLPLVRVGGLLTAAPITEAERKRLPLQEGLLLLQNGEAIVTPLPEASREEPASWLDLSAWQATPVVSLGAPPLPPIVVAEAPTFDARAKMQGVPPANPQGEEVAQKLQAAIRAQREGRNSPAERLGEPSASPVKKMLWPFLERLAHMGEGAGRAGAGGEGGSQGAGRMRQGLGVAPQSNAEGLSPLQSWLKHTAARTLMMTGLARQIGQKQADYMGRMIEMFEKGELDEALRHAIPLGGESSGENLPPSLSIPTARNSLQITSGVAKSSMDGGMELFTDLRSLYRQAFEKLERKGRIEEAAFVLAELLHSSAEAVAFLEKHGKLQLAAEIAEARKLGPELIVRQWLLAGNRERAILIARRHKAFQAAIELLGRKDPEKALELRRIWAQLLAEAGDYVAAVDLLWPNPATRAETLPWIQQTLAFGGASAARMLPRLLELTPDDPELQPRILALLADEDPEQAPARKEFAQSLCETDVTPRAATLARAALRALLRDALLVPWLTEKELFRRLQNYGADAALRADLPNLPAEATGEALNQRETPLILEWAAHDVGALALSDAAFLPNGRCLVALGEAGIRLLTRDGRTVTHFDQPAHRLVMADNGQRAIAVAPRGTVMADTGQRALASVSEGTAMVDIGQNTLAALPKGTLLVDDSQQSLTIAPDSTVLRLARLDLTTLRAAHWCETTLQTFAPDYDGSLWFVATATDLLALDAVSERFQALWRTPGLTGSPVQITRDLQDCALLMRQPQLTPRSQGAPQLAETWWMWHFALPSLMMRDRQEQSPPDLRFAFTRGIAPGGATAELLVRKMETLGVGEKSFNSTDDLVQLGVNARVHFSDAFYAQQAQPMEPLLTEAWVLAPIRFDQGVRVRLYDRAKGQHRATLTLLGAKLLSARLSATHLTLADDRGRLIVLNLLTGALTRDLRLS